MAARTGLPQGRTQEAGVAGGRQGAAPAGARNQESGASSARPSEKVEAGRALVARFDAEYACRDLACQWRLRIRPLPAERATLLELHHADGRSSSVAIDNRLVASVVADLLIASGRTPDLPPHPEENHDRVIDGSSPSTTS